MTRPRYFVGAILGLILLAAGALRFYKLDLNSIWIDEDFTYLSTTGTQFRGYLSIPTDVILQHPPQLTNPAYVKPWWSVLHPDTQDIHPPLYFFLLRIWASVAGWTASDLRAFSILMSLVALAFLFAVVRELSGTAAGLWAAALMAVAQPQIDLAREARSYVMVLALGLATAWALIRIEKYGVNSRRLLALLLGCLALPLTHYFALTIDFTLVAYALIRLQGKQRRAAVGACLAALLLFTCVWGPVLYAQAHGTSSGGTTVYRDTEPNHFTATLLRLGLMPIRYLFEPLPSMLVTATALSVLYIFPFLLLRKRPDLLLWGLWLPINIFPSLLVDATRHTFSLEIDRYVFFASVSIYALIPSLFSRFALPWRHTIPALVVLACLPFVSQALSTFGRTRQNWRQFAADYRNVSAPGCLTVFPSKPADFTYFLCVGRYVSPLPGPAIVLTKPASPDLMQQIRRFDRVVAVGDMETIDRLIPHTRISDLKQMQAIGIICRLYFDAPATSPQTSIAPPALPHPSP